MSRTRIDFTKWREYYTIPDFAYLLKVPQGVLQRLIDGEHLPCHYMAGKDMIPTRDFVSYLTEVWANQHAERTPPRPWPTMTTLDRKLLERLWYHKESEVFTYNMLTARRCEALGWVKLGIHRVLSPATCQLTPKGLQMLLDIETLKEVAP